MSDPWPYMVTIHTTNNQGGVRGEGRNGFIDSCDQAVRAFDHFSWL